MKCVFRSIEAVETIEFSDTEIIDFISQTEDYSKVNLWDCSDIALNLFVRMKKPAIEKLSNSSAPGGAKKGVVTFLIQSTLDQEHPEGERGNWSDIYLDESILRGN